MTDTLPLLAHRHAAEQWSPIVRDSRSAPSASCATHGPSRRLLPRGAHVLNVCADRYRFAVGFAACLLSARISLLPSTHTPEVIQQLTRFAPDVFCLTDDTGCDIDLPRLQYPAAAGS